MFFMFLRSHNMIFFQVNLYLSYSQHTTQSNGMDYVLSGLIEFNSVGNQTQTKFGIQFGSIANLN